MDADICNSDFFNKNPRCKLDDICATRIFTVKTRVVNLSIFPTRFCNKTPSCKLNWTILAGRDKIGMECYYSELWRPPCSLGENFVWENFAWENASDKDKPSKVGKPLSDPEARKEKKFSNITGFGRQLSRVLLKFHSYRTTHLPPGTLQPYLLLC